MWDRRGLTASRKAIGTREAGFASSCMSIQVTFRFFISFFYLPQRLRPVNPSEAEAGEGETGEA